MLPTLARRLDAARAQSFVGRDTELAAFRDALAAPRWPHPVLLIHGPGGVGKTALLRELARLARDAEVPVAQVDGRDLPLHAPALAELLPASLPDAPRSLLLVDGYERLASLDRWFRERFLPTLPDGVCVVLAGRRRPHPAWTCDPGWRDLARVVPLTDLRPDAARLLLARAGLPEDEQARVAELTRGHPLALALCVDAHRRGRARVALDQPDLVGALVDTFLGDVREPHHLAALELAAIVRVTSRDLLGLVVPEAEIDATFAWLRGLPFMQPERGGVSPHDLVREVLQAHFRWSAPGRYQELLARVVQHYGGTLGRNLTPADTLQLLGLWLQLGEADPVTPKVLDLEGMTRFHVDHARPGDEEAIAEMSAAHLGPAGVARVEHWLAHRLDAFLVARDAEGEVYGYDLLLPLHALSPVERAADPVADAAAAHFEGARRGEGERATLSRFWMAHDVFQGRCAATSALTVYTLASHASNEGVVANYAACGRPALWAAAYAASNAFPLPELDFEEDGRAFGMFLRETRQQPLGQVMARRAASFAAAPGVEPAASSVAPLERGAFDEAVAEALDAFGAGPELEASPLLDQPLVQRHAHEDASLRERAELLRQLVCRALEELDDAPKKARYARAVFRTYVMPAGTQRDAAERLGVPFGTFRRHLERGRAELQALLWAANRGERPLTP